MGFAWFKAALFALLAWNTAVYVHSGTLSEALDSTAWLALLVLFALETDFGERPRRAAAATAIRTGRLVAAAAVWASLAGYLGTREWLDAFNTACWIGVVALLELQVRWPGAALRYRRRFAAGTAALYAGLGATVLAWTWRGEWFDAYDAALWLTALAVIEFDMLRGLPRGAGSAPPRAV